AVRGFQQKDPLPVAAFHDEPVHALGPDGMDQVFRLIQLPPQLFVLVTQALEFVHGRDVHDAYLARPAGPEARYWVDGSVRTSRATSARSVFERSPMILRIGSGSL